MHSETGKVADSVELKIGRSAMRMCGLESQGGEEDGSGGGAPSPVEDGEEVVVEGSAVARRFLAPPALLPGRDGVGDTATKAADLVQESK